MQIYRSVSDLASNKVTAAGVHADLEECLRPGQQQGYSSYCVILLLDRLVLAKNNHS